MKPLRRFIAVLPLVFMTSCDLFTNFFNPKLPDKIIPNTDRPVEIALSADPSSGYTPLLSNLSIKLKDPDGDAITEYGFEIDFGDEGTIDKFIPQSMSTTETFSEGNSRVYAYAKSNGVRVKRNLEVKVVKPIPGNLPPTGGKLLINPPSGEYPFTAIISTPDWTDLDGTIKDYVLNLIFKTESAETSETVTSSTPFDNFTRTYNDVGNLTAYLTVTDDKGEGTRTSSSADALEREDLTANINFTYPQNENHYHIGNNFNFFVEVQDNTANEITITNSNASPSLEYRLIKEDGTLVFNKKFPYDFLIRMHPMGTIKLSYQDTTATTVISNVYIESKLTGNWDVVPSLFPQGISKSISDPGETLNESGTYILQARANYSINGTPFHVTLNSTSVVVNE
jgi:hypothetical protein